MINLHPTSQQLLDYVSGDASPTMALVISAHCDMCTQCRETVEAMQAKLAGHAIDEAEVDTHSLDPALEAMMTSITAKPSLDIPQITIPTPSIELDGREFKLPSTLRRYAAKTGNWSHLLGNLWQAPVDLGGEERANFIYMEKGGKVPEHTHRGSELTLVIDGEFSDGHRNYDSGDFILMNGNDTHTPHSEAEEGCLVFSVVDKPLQFTSGAARLLNPFSHLFF